MARCIGLNGKVASGKTKLALRLNLRCGVKHVVAGDEFRRIATELGISGAELETRARFDPEIDRRIDQYMYKQALGARDSNEFSAIILDGRRTAEIVPWSDAILLYCPDDEERFHRVSNREGISFEEAVRLTHQREEDFCARFMIARDQFLNPDTFCLGRERRLVINTLENNEEAVFWIVLKALQDWGYADAH